MGNDPHPTVAIERLRGRIEALELIFVPAIVKLSTQDDGMRRDVLKTIRDASESGVVGLSPVALSSFREVLAQVIRHLEQP